MYKNGVNFNITGRTMIEDYIQLVSKAMNESIENTNYFIQTYKRHHVQKNENCTVCSDFKMFINNNTRIP